MTASRTPAQFHYAESERLLAAAESSGTAEIQNTAALIAIGHAILAGAPRRARRRPAPPSPRTAGGTLADRWVRGEFDKPDDEGTEPE